MRARSARALARQGILRQLAHGIGDGVLALIAAVEIEQRRTGCGVAHPVHQLPKTGARIRRELVPGMTKIMKVDHRQARCAKRREPDTRPEAAMWQRPPGRGGEDQALVTGCREGEHVLAKRRRLSGKRAGLGLPAWMLLDARVDLIRRFTPDQFDRALESWHWIGIGDKSPLFTSPFW